MAALLDPSGTQTELRTTPLPTALALSNPFPNPTDGSVALTLDLPKDSQVGFDVFDIQGRVVWGAESRAYNAGHWTLRWDGMTSRGHAGAGIYLARVKVNGQTLMRRFAVVR